MGMSRRLKLFFLIETVLVLVLACIAINADADPAWKASDSLQKAGVGHYAAPKRESQPEVITWTECYEVRRVDGTIATVCRTVEKPQ